ncbi:hypothetical protein GCM10023205_68470 [Yinghuangia aomiensis]|uniref:HTH tetR-type domain-containing protein n=1 Tax=Yinghuangia aomiensis TaxID=676205 RepID=A0ABP9I5I0_9ACTN
MTPKRRPGRPARTNRDQIVRAALDVDAQGGAVSMQAVADRLGVTPAALCHHVADRDELVAGVAVARLDAALDDSWMPGARRRCRSSPINVRSRSSWRQVWTIAP